MAFYLVVFNVTGAAKCSDWWWQPFMGCVCVCMYVGVCVCVCWAILSPYQHIQKEITVICQKIPVTLIISLRNDEIHSASYLTPPFHILNYRYHICVFWYLIQRYRGTPPLWFVCKRKLCTVISQQSLFEEECLVWTVHERKQTWILYSDQQTE